MPFEPASVCVLQHTLDLIPNLICVGKGAKSDSRGQEQGARPQRCMTPGARPCIMAAVCDAL